MATSLTSSANTVTIAAVRVRMADAVTALPCKENAITIFWNRRSHTARERESPFFYTKAPNDRIGECFVSMYTRTDKQQRVLQTNKQTLGRDARVEWCKRTPKLAFQVVVLP